MELNDLCLYSLLLMFRPDGAGLGRGQKMELNDLSLYSLLLMFRPGGAGQKKYYMMPKDIESIF